MLLWLLRSCFIALVLGMAGFAFNYYSEFGEYVNGVKAVLVIFAVAGAVIFTDLWERDKQITTISAVYFGLLLGLLLGWLFSLALEPFLKEWFPGNSLEGRSPMTQLGRFLITVVCCYISISTLLQTKDEFRFIIPYVEFAKQLKGGKPLVLDTSVIIDGRIADIAETGFIEGTFVIPTFVLRELQLVADSADSMKRNRGRRGLDILSRIQKNPDLHIRIVEEDFPQVREVDMKLLELAKHMHAKVLTNDFNLNKVAQIHGVEVLNINELANSLRPVVLPGELMKVFILKEGKEQNQGVAYLDDGTMVVVDNARKMISKTIEISVTSVLQTTAGKMIFGRFDERTHSAEKVQAALH